MAVLDHPVSELVREAPDAKWGCWNRPDKFADGYYAPDRTYRPDGSFRDGHVFIRHVMSHECRNDASMTDRKCEGCRHRGYGGKYAESVRANGS